MTDNSSTLYSDTEHALKNKSKKSIICHMSSFINCMQYEKIISMIYVMMSARE